MKKYFLLFCFFIFQLSFSQEAEIFKLKKYKTANLSDSLKESSGLNFFNGKLYTFNDSGNSGDLFEIDSHSGKIVKKLPTTLRNIDWEALSNDGTHFYIGDFGNNAGTRKDLKIYKIPFINDSLQIKNVQELLFFYPEQKDFTPKNLNTNFDAEAMIFLNGKIHIFTKEWASKSVSHYIIDPSLQGIQLAQKIESYPTGFVITDAAYFDKKLYLIGYTKKTEVFLNVFDETEKGIFFSNKPKHLYLGTAFGLGQIEGITVDKDGIYISGEQFKSPLGIVKQRFYFVPQKDL